MVSSGTGRPGAGTQPPLASPAHWKGKIYNALEQSRGSASEGGRQGRKAETALSRRAGQGWWIKGPIARFLLSFLTPSPAWQEGLDGCVAEDYEFARGKAKGGSIVCRSPPHVVSPLVNIGCLLTRMRRLNNPGGRLNTPHQGSGSQQHSDPSCGLTRAWRRVGINGLQGALG